MATLIHRYMARCPFCKETFAIEGAAPWQMWPTANANAACLAVVERHGADCPKILERLAFRAGSRIADPVAAAAHAYDIVTADLRIRQVRGTVRADVPCNGKCTHAKGHDCECSCGGKNHGSGR